MPILQESIRRLRYRAEHAYASLFPERYKEAHELAYWRSKAASEGVLGNGHYAYFYTEFFGLPRGFYTGRRVLDIGCGPRGSLEWADEASERVGLDPLAEEYMKLGADRHKMRYVDAPSEKIPFGDAHFDVVCSFNSLDHVADLERTLAEIRRVLVPGGLFLLIVETGHEPTPCEPIAIRDVAQFADAGLRLEDLRKYEIGDHNIYRQLRNDARWHDEDPRPRAGIAAARFVRQAD